MHRQNKAVTLTAHYSKKFLVDFSKKEGVKILLSHEPCYYSFVKDYNIDLMVSGHTHGGQWRLFDIGVYNTTEGFFPKYTKGLYEEDKLFVTSGVSNPVLIPRIFNPYEVSVLEV